MLASRGFTYLSEDSAGLEMQYHRDCDCQIVPSWGRQTLAGYNPERLTAMWQEASKGGGDYREKLKRMRRDNPMAFTDGVYPTPTMPWEQSVRLLSMKRHCGILVPAPARRRRRPEQGNPRTARDRVPREVPEAGRGIRVDTEKP